MDQNQNRRIRWKALILLLCAVIIFTLLATAIVTPKRTDFGCLWDQFRKEPKQSLDVIYLGTSIAYTDMIPAVIYRESGLTSFSMAGPVQSMAESYYYLREITKTQQPKLVMLELTGLLLETDPHYDLINIGYMPNGMNKWHCMAETAPKSDWVQYLFPLYVYHSRWNEVTLSEIVKSFLPAKTDPMAGYTLLTDVTPFEQHEEKTETYTEESFRTGAEYLQKIADYCAENEIRLLMCLSPRCNIIDDAGMAKLSELVASVGAEYLDFDTLRDEIGIDDLTDFFDSSHLNVTGAEKYSVYLAGYFTQVCGLAPGNADSALWNERVEHFASAKEDDDA